MTAGITIQAVGVSVLLILLPLVVSDGVREWRANRKISVRTRAIAFSMSAPIALAAPSLLRLTGRSALVVSLLGLVLAVIGLVWTLQARRSRAL